MGLVYADIILTNSEDIVLAKRNLIGLEEIKQITVNMLVDTGSYNLCINEDIQAQLQLPFVEKRNAQLSNGHIVSYDVVGPVHLKFKNRNTVCLAMVLEGSNEPLLGAIPLEDMDVIVHPQSQQLVVNPDHPFYAQMKLK